MKRFALALLTLLLPAVASAQTTVLSPKAGAKLSTSVWVRASTIGCSGHPSTAFGYSIDNQTAYHPGVTPRDIDTVAKVAAGSHIIHFKSWTNNGLCPIVNVAFTVGAPLPPPPPPPAPGLVIPGNATVIGLNNLGNWKGEYDAGTPGSASGSTTYPVALMSPDNLVRQFDLSYTGAGGYRWHVSFGIDTVATHFVYDTLVYLDTPDTVANLELDMNQVLANGDTVILGVQCSSYSKTWEYTTTVNGHAHWNASNLPCNPRTWTAKTWHHVQIESHRDDAGNSYYDSVTLDDAYGQFLNASGPNGRNLGWTKGDLLINFQIDGVGSAGSARALADNLQVYRW
jgi:hypothetical protein